MIILPGMVGMGLDPSQPKFPSGLGAKMTIDATISFEETEHMIRLPEEQMRYVRDHWSDYGFERILTTKSV